MEGVAIQGEGADECILQDVTGVASGQKVGFEIEGTVDKVGAMGTNHANAEELAVVEAPAGWMYSNPR